MGQVKIYGIKENLNPIKTALSALIHQCVVTAFELPSDKKFHRFFPMDQADFFFPEGRTEAYTIIAFRIFEGRTIETKRKLVQTLFESIKKEFNIAPEDIEIMIFETPKHNWEIRGLPGDELALHYKVNV